MRMDYRPFITGRDPRSDEAAIYVLTDEDGSARYVGKTVSPLRHRLGAHWNGSTCGGPSRFWIRDLETPPRMEVLMYVPRDEAQRWEKVVIQAHLAEGSDLLNVQRRNTGEFWRSVQRGTARAAGK